MNRKTPEKADADFPGSHQMGWLHRAQEGWDLATDLHRLGGEGHGGLKGLEHFRIHSYERGSVITGGPLFGFGVWFALFYTTKFTFR